MWTQSWQNSQLILIQCSKSYNHPSRTSICSAYILINKLRNLADFSSLEMSNNCPDFVKWLFLDVSQLTEGTNWEAIISLNRILIETFEAFIPSSENSPKNDFYQIVFTFSLILKLQSINCDHGQQMRRYNLCIFKYDSSLQSIT